MGREDEREVVALDGRVVHLSTSKRLAQIIYGVLDPLDFLCTNNMFDVK